jgi:hypothetical protein
MVVRPFPRVVSRGRACQVDPRPCLKECDGAVQVTVVIRAVGEDAASQRPPAARGHETGVALGSEPVGQEPASTPQCTI